MIAENIAKIKKNIIQACERSGRNPEDVTLLSVSKTKPVSMLQEAYNAGSRDFGENKVQEIIEKHDKLPEDARFHMIGHLQRNKVKQLLPLVYMIHSVDSLKLAMQIEEEAAKIDKIIDVLLEINVAREESKFGVYLEDAERLLLQIKDFPHLRVRGLMTIAPFVEKAEENREYFKKLYQFSVDMNSKNIDNINMDVLSMGMSNDYEIAIEEGATIIRIGTDIFGSR